MAPNTGTISFSGLATGIPINEMIDSIIEAEKFKAKKLESWKNEWEEKLEVIKEVNLKMNSFRESLKPLSDRSTFVAKMGTSSDKSVADLSVDSSALTSNYEIEVFQLARSASRIHEDGVEDSWRSTAGTISYSYGEGDVINLSVSADKTIQEVADLINKDSNNPGIQASVIRSGDNYHLVLKGKDTGAKYQIDDLSMDDIDLLGGFSNVEALNSQIKLNSWPPGEEDFIENESNLLTELISGASVNLKGIGFTSLVIENDQDAMLEKIENFVESYNETMKYLQDITKYDLETGEKGILIGNYVMNTLQANLKMFVTEPARGFDADDDKYSVFAQIGIEHSGFDSFLSIDEEKLRSILQIEPEKVISLFSDDKVGVSSIPRFTFLSSTGLTEPGFYNVEVSYDAEGNINSARYRDQDGDTWYNLIVEDNTLTATRGPARGMALIYNGGGVDTDEFQVRIRQGKAQEYVKLKTQLVDKNGILRDYHPNEASTKVLVENYDNIIENIDRKIESELDRVKMVEKRLRMRFARLEVITSNYNAQMERVQAQIAQLPRGI